MITQDNSGVSVLLGKLEALPVAIRESLSLTAQSLGALLKQEIESNLSGQILHSKSGALLGSIEEAQDENNAGVNVSIAAANNVPYAAILEYGGQTKAHIIQATQAKVMAFIGNGKQMFLPYVFHPGSQIPEFAYMRTALDALKDEITDRLSEAVLDLLATI